MTDANSHQLREISQLIPELGNKVNSIANRSCESLLKTDIYPSMVSDVDTFIRDYIYPVLDFLATGNESVRESLTKYISKSYLSIEPPNLDRMLSIIVHPLYKRLEEENSEYVVLAIINLLSTLLNSITETSSPSSWDQYFTPAIDMTKGLVRCIQLDSPDIKKQVAKLIILISGKCSTETLKGDAPRLVLTLLRNLVHNQQEVRRLTLSALSHLYLKSGIVEHLDTKVFDILTRLSMDRSTAVRKELINFVRLLLTEHVSHEKLYNPLIIILLVAVKPIVPSLPITPGKFEPPRPAKYLKEEAEIAFTALQAIGEKHFEDKHEEYQAEAQEYKGDYFDDTRTFNLGLRHIFRDNCERLLNNILPRIVEWKEDSRKFGYLALRPLLHFVKDQSARMCNEIINALYISLRDHPETEDALQTAAILAANVPGSEIVKAIVLRDAVTKQWIQLLIVATLNAGLSDGDLDLIRQNLQDREVYMNIECLESYVELLLVMIERHHEFADRNAVSLLNLILKGCEHADALGPFENAFGRPISEVFSDHLRQLLSMGDGSPTFLRQFLLTAPAASVQRNQDAVLVCLESAMEKASAENKTKLQIMIREMANVGCFAEVDEEFVDDILKDMEWRSGKDYFPSRAEATATFTAMIKAGAMRQETLQNYTKLMPALLSDYDDTWCDPVRINAVDAIITYLGVAPAEAVRNDWDALWAAVKDRLNDTNLAVRIGSAQILEVLVPMCAGVEKVPEVFDEMFLFIDDTQPKMQDAMQKVAIAIGNVPEWNELVTTSLQSHHESTTHTRAKDMYQTAITAIKK